VSPEHPGVVFTQVEENIPQHFEITIDDDRGVRRHFEKKKKTFDQKRTRDNDADETDNGSSENIIWKTCYHIYNKKK
jgi:hypothetical protein